MSRRADARDPRGYFGVAMYHSKSTYNWGSLFRTAQIMGADCLFSIGQRYKTQNGLAKERTP